MVGILITLFTRLYVVVGILITLFTLLYVRVGILLTCGKHISDRIISLRGEVWADKTSNTTSNKTPPFLIEVPVPNQ